MSPLGPGSEIDGFCLGEMIHAGSMASIYRLMGPEGPLPLIMKIPRLGPGERAVNVISFEVCRMVLGALAQGPHHPTLVAYGDVETTPYLVMEFIEGARLNDWAVRAPVTPEEIARLGSAFALALHDVHRQDVVHLDLKPTNVMYRANGEAVLIDFGLAHHRHYPDLLAEELRFPVGNWVYMAPEQVLGVRCDPRSDIYALGGILYELATGRLPFGKPRSLAAAAQAALPRSGPAARDRRRDPRMAAGDHPALPRSRRPRALRLGRTGCIRPGEPVRRWRSPSAAHVRPPRRVGDAAAPHGCGPGASNPRRVRRHRPRSDLRPSCWSRSTSAQPDEALFEALRAQRGA